jgi:hypothetical protein
MITHGHQSKFNTLVNEFHHWITNDRDDHNYDGANILRSDFHNT